MIYSFVQILASRGTMDDFVVAVKQYPGQQQVTRRVRVKVPGKHFPQLQTAEQLLDFWGEAVEFKERHTFPRHAKAWGAAHTGPGIRFICTSDAIDDPDTKGFWTTIGLWNRWRHDTYNSVEGVGIYIAYRCTVQ